jgi:hypothetical protein
VPDAKLWFLGLHLTTENADHMRVAQMAVRRAEELGLTGTSVFFGDWVPYELRESYLLEADLGVTVARDLAETRLSFRTRVLDYLWAGLPVVTTEGDVLSDLVRNEDLGRVVPPGDPVALADAVVDLLRSPVARTAMSHRARGVAARFRWSRAVGPLRRVIAEPWRWEESRAYRPRAERVTEGLRSSYEEATHRRGQVVSGPRAAVALDRAASQESVDRAMNFLLRHPAMARSLYLAAKARHLGLRRTASYVKGKAAGQIASRRGR